MEPHLAERADALLRRATALRRRCERIEGRLDELAQAVPDAAPIAPEPSEGIRVVATNLALSGADRDEVHARLAETFGAIDSGPLLDEVFAAATSSELSANGRFARQD
jgi:hypothetical protein